jgi:hypothetical protein
MYSPFILLRKKYNLTPQTTTFFLDGSSNYQGLHYDPQTTKSFEKYPF